MENHYYESYSIHNNWYQSNGFGTSYGGHTMTRSLVRMESNEYSRDAADFFRNTDAFNERVHSDTSKLKADSSQPRPTVANTTRKDVEVDFPKFDGLFPRTWLRRCERYFAINPMSEHDKVFVASIHLDGEARDWYSENIEGWELIGWEAFANMVLERFVNQIVVAADRFLSDEANYEELSAKETVTIEGHQVFDKMPKPESESQILTNREGEYLVVSNVDLNGEEGTTEKLNEAAVDKEFEKDFVKVELLFDESVVGAEVLVENSIEAEFANLFDKIKDGKVMESVLEALVVGESEYLNVNKLDLNAKSEEHKVLDKRTENHTAALFRGDDSTRCLTEGYTAVFRVAAGCKAWKSQWPIPCPPPKPPPSHLQAKFHGQLVSEKSDVIHGWSCTIMVLSMTTFEKLAFRNINSGKFSLGDLPYLGGENKLSESVKNIEKFSDSALDFKEIFDTARVTSEASRWLWPSATHRTALFELIMGIIGQISGLYMNTSDDGFSSPISRLLVNNVESVTGNCQPKQQLDYANGISYTQKTNEQSYFDVAAEANQGWVPSSNSGIVLQNQNFELANEIGGSKEDFSVIPQGSMKQYFIMRFHRVKKIESTTKKIFENENIGLAGDNDSYSDFGDRRYLIFGDIVDDRVVSLINGLYFSLRNEEHFHEIRTDTISEFNWMSEWPDDLPLYEPGRGDVREIWKRLSCHQDISSDGCFFSLGMVACFELTLKEMGAWMYPRLFRETGVFRRIEDELYCRRVYEWPYTIISFTVSTKCKVPDGVYEIIFEFLLCAFPIFNSLTLKAGVWLEIESYTGLVGSKFMFQKNEMKEITTYLTVNDVELTLAIIISLWDNCSGLSIILMIIHCDAVSHVTSSFTSRCIDRMAHRVKLRWRETRNEDIKDAWFLDCNYQPRSQSFESVFVLKLKENNTWLNCQGSDFSISLPRSVASYKLSDLTHFDDKGDRKNSVPQLISEDERKQPLGRGSEIILKLVNEVQEFWGEANCPNLWGNESHLVIETTDHGARMVSHLHKDDCDIRDGAVANGDNIYRRRPPPEPPPWHYSAQVVETWINHSLGSIYRSLEDKAVIRGKYVTILIGRGVIRQRFDEECFLPTRNVFSYLTFSYIIIIKETAPFCLNVLTIKGRIGEIIRHAEIEIELA